MDSATLLILFDGECAFCSGWVRFLAARDARNVFRFCALQDAAAAKLLDDKEIPAGLDSIVVLHKGNLVVESDAVLLLAARLPFPWTLLRAGRILPSALRNAVYRFIARHRHALPGAAPHCVINDQAVRSRLVNPLQSS